MWDLVTYSRENLKNNQEVLNYLIDCRKLNRNSIDTFMIGFLNKNDSMFLNPLYSSLKGLGGRFIIPILSEFGKEVVGFTSRIPSASEKGWWNTRFKKSAYLYGLSNARPHAYRKNKIYVVEGCMDSIIMHQYGLKNTVAMMSSSLGLKRIGLLTRYCTNVCLCFDTDRNDAGTLGLLRTMADLYFLGYGKEDYNVSMIRLPLGVDADEYICYNGLQNFLGLEQMVDSSLLKKSSNAYEELKWRLNERKKREREQ